MVGHTGDIEATVVACKAADEAVKVRFFLWCIFFCLVLLSGLLLMCESSLVSILTCVCVLACWVFFSQGSTLFFKNPFGQVSVVL